MLILSCASLRMYTRGSFVSPSVSERLSTLFRAAHHNTAVDHKHSRWSLDDLSEPVSLFLSSEMMPGDLVMFTGSYTNTHSQLGSLLWCTGYTQRENPSNGKLLINKVRKIEPIWMFFKNLIRSTWGWRRALLLSILSFSNGTILPFEDSGILNNIAYLEHERELYLVIHAKTSRFLDYIHQHIIYWASRICQKDLENKITYWALCFGANEWLQ